MSRLLDCHISKCMANLLSTFLGAKLDEFPCLFLQESCTDLISEKIDDAQDDGRLLMPRMRSRILGQIQLDCLSEATIPLVVECCRASPTHDIFVGELDFLAHVLVGTAVIIYS